MRNPLAATLLGVSLLACSRDLNLPARPPAPRIDSISPDTAYAGQVITLTGSGFAQTAAANQVQFGTATARGEGSDGTHLVLHVPADAGSGPITVTTPDGVSQPSTTAFTYRGLGQLRHSAVAREQQLLHRPFRVIAAAGETFLSSDLIVGLARYSDPAFVAATESSTVPLPGGTAIAWVESDTSASNLVRLDVAGAGTPQRTAVDWTGLAALAVITSSASPELALVRNASGGASLELRGLGDGFPVVQADLSLPYSLSRGCADAGGGRLACLMQWAPGGDVLLALVVPSQLDGSTEAGVTALTPPSAVHHEGTERDDPMCVAIGAGGHHLAVVGLESGQLVTADLDAATPAFGAPFSSGSSGPAHSLTCVGGAAVVVPKPADDVLTMIDVETRSIQWAVNLPRAARAGLDASTGILHVASDADNDVLLLDPATGALLGRRSFDVAPGRVTGSGTSRTALQAAAYLPQSGIGRALVFATAHPRGVLAVPIQPEGGVYPQYLDVTDAIGVINGTVDRYVALRDQAIGDVALTGGHAVQLAVDGATDATAGSTPRYVGTGEGLLTLVGATQTLSYVSSADFVSLGVLPDGRVYAGLWDGFEWAVKLWTPEHAAAGHDADATWVVPGSESTGGTFAQLDGVAFVDGQLWAFYWDGSSTDHAVQLDPDQDLAAVSGSATRLSDTLLNVVTVSPNGRTLVSWERQPFSQNTSVVIWSAADAFSYGFPRIATVPLDGLVSGAAFDGTGEKLYVLTRNPDRIVVLE